MLFIGKDKVLIVDLKSQLFVIFEMKDFGAEKNILGMEIRRDHENGKLWLSQSKYFCSVLQRFNIQACTPLCVPITLYCDSQSAIFLVRNLIFHARTKHNDV